MVIVSEKQYHDVLAVIAAFLQRGFSELSAVEDKHLDECSKAVEIWEMEKYPMPVIP